MKGYETLSKVGLRLFIEDVIECLNIDDNNNVYGCILEVDLEYLEELHKAHNISFSL